MPAYTLDLCNERQKDEIKSEGSSPHPLPSPGKRVGENDSFLSRPLLPCLDYTCRIVDSRNSLSLLVKCAKRIGLVCQTGSRLSPRAGLLGVCAQTGSRLSPRAGLLGMCAQTGSRLIVINTVVRVNI